MQQQRAPGRPRPLKLGLTVAIGNHVLEYAAAANARLRGALDRGMTLVLSHWAGTMRDNMAWLDQPCSPQEGDPGLTRRPHRRRRPPSCHRALAFGYGSAPAAEASFSACYEPQQAAVMP